MDKSGKDLGGTYKNFIHVRMLEGPSTLKGEESTRVEQNLVDEIFYHGREGGGWAVVGIPLVNRKHNHRQHDFSQRRLTAILHS